MGFRRGFKAEANRIALRVRAQMGLRAIDPIDPTEICVHFDISLVRLSDLDSESPFLVDDNSLFSAVTVPCGLTTAIVHNDSPIRTANAATSVMNWRTAFWDISARRR